MILFPAIDIKDGRCVRLQRGEMSAATVYNDEPAEQARQFQALGFEWLHLVDLNGALSGKSVNGATVESIVRSVDIPVQLGGGIREMSQIERWLEAGVRRVILGTAALHNPELVQEACRKFPMQIVVGIDSRAGKVAVEGWVQTSEIASIELARRFEGAGVAALIYTDIDRDGILAGLNMGSTLELARAVSIPVIASGGLASIEDVRRLLEPDCAVLEGAISGRALYDGRLDPRRALELIRSRRAA
jgi:phosphoribosylformimino-5-aminoimidazole carboxamide ribotide isomerase